MNFTAPIGGRGQTGRSNQVEVGHQEPADGRVYVRVADIDVVDDEFELRFEPFV